MQKPKHRRERSIIWFNPPFNERVATNIGKSFLFLINKHFPPSHKYRKIYNRNNINLSYSCSPSIQSIINPHNCKLLKQEDDNPIIEKPNLCNCRQPDECPLSLSGRCLMSSMIYKASFFQAGNNI